MGGHDRLHAVTEAQPGDDVLTCVLTVVSDRTSSHAVSAMPSSLASDVSQHDVRPQTLPG